jgi:5-methylcytosine-specific restriction protein A
MSTSTPYNTRAWKRVRLAILARDGYRCQIQGPRCKGTATEVDHILELHAGGAPLHPSNLRAACKSCNSSRGAAYGNRTRHPRSEDPYQ